MWPIRIPDFGHTCLQKQLTKITFKTFGSPSRKLGEKETTKKTRIAISKLFALNANAKNKFIMINSLVLIYFYNGMDLISLKPWSSCHCGFGHIY